MRKLIFLLLALPLFVFGQSAQRHLNAIVVSALDTDFKIALPAFSLVYVESNNTLYQVNGYFTTAQDMNDVIAAGSATALGAGGFSDPMTTRGDIIIRNAANATARLGIGANGEVLKSDGTDIAWGTDIGFADPMTTRGDIIYRNAANATARLAVGTNGQILKSDGTDFAWGADVGFANPLTTQGDIIVQGAGGTTRLAVGTNGQYLTTDGTDVSWGAVTASPWTESGNIVYVGANDSIGVGTATPSYDFHVVGDGYFSDDLTIGDSLFVDVISMNDADMQTLAADTFYTPIDTAAAVMNGLLVSDGANLQTYWLPWDSLPSGGTGDTSYFDLATNRITTKSGIDEIATDSLILGSDADNVNGVLTLVADDGDDMYMTINNSNEFILTGASTYNIGGSQLYLNGDNGASGLGGGNTQTGLYSTAIGFYHSTAYNYSTAIGYRARTNTYCELAFSSGYFASEGDAQGSEYISRISATHADDTWYTMYVDGSSETIDIPASGVWFFRADIVMTNDAQDTTGAYTITGHIKRDASNNTTLMQSTVTEHFETNTNYLVRAAADDTNEALAIQCQLTTGHTAASTVRRWVTSVETTQVKF